MQEKLASLEIQIDEGKKEEDINHITENEYFQNLLNKVELMKFEGDAKEDEDENE